jgi:hypothetical protein
MASKPLPAKTNAPRTFQQRQYQAPTGTPRPPLFGTSTKAKTTAPPAVKGQGTGTRKPPLFGTSKVPKTTAPPAVKGHGKHQDLAAYMEKYELKDKGPNANMKPGEPNNTANVQSYKTVSNLVDKETKNPAWKADLETPAMLRKTTFGRPDKDHSVTQVACFETTLFFLLKSNYLDEDSTRTLYDTNPLIPHMARMIDTLSDYDFRWIKNTDKDWASQTAISEESRKAMMACLFHYDLDVSLLMRYLGGNYTGVYRDIPKTVRILREHNISDDLIEKYIRVMTVGCPISMNVEISRDNALQYWRGGNNESIKKNLPKVKKTMNKENKNKFTAPLSGWSWRFIPHLFFTPIHLLQKPGKKDRIIYDAAFRHTADSIPINMMTEDASTAELRCLFGLVKLRLYTRIYNLRITYPMLEIILHANDVKSCFRQLKHHPDCMGAFSFIIDDILFLQLGLTFGSDFSPASWEVVRQIIEILAESLFDDKSLRTKHRKYLDRMQWQKSLGSKKAKFTVATKDELNKGVLDEHGNPVNTPHDMFVDDDVYADIYDEARERMEQAAAASIEAIFITLGESDLSSRQDPISFDKFEEMMVAWSNRVLGVDINTRRLAVRTPVEYVEATIKILQDTWHDGRHSFTIFEAESMTGRLGYIAETSPWLRFMMSCMHTSIARALGATRIHLMLNSSGFRAMLKAAKRNLKPVQGNPRDDRSTSQHRGKPSLHNKEIRRQSFASSQAARAIHRSRKTFPITMAMRKELTIICEALSSPWIDMWRPLGHLIKREPSGIGYSDSSLHAAGGYSLCMGFWWYIEWPKAIHECTLKFVYNNKEGKLISINALEYASLIINYVAASYVLAKVCPSPGDPHPVVLLYADNSTAESWLIKASKSSHAGRALGYIQAAFMINNPVGTNVGHVPSEDNEIADKISRIASESVLLAGMQEIYKKHPSLTYCQRFHPNAELISLILDTLSTKKFVDPLQISRRILANPGKITT